MKLERKLLIILTISLLIGSSLSPLWASRTITTSSDTVYTQIYNSKGNTWTATGANLQLAMYDLNTTGGTVYVPPGTFYTPGTSWLYLVNKTKIIGSGPESTIIKAANGITAGGGVLLGSSSRKIQNVTIQDLTIDGNYTQDGLNCFGSKNITVCNVIVRKAITTGLHFQEVGSTMRNCSHIMLSNIRAYNISTWQPIAFYGANSVVMNNIIIINGTSQAIDLARGCDNFSINNVYIKDCAGGLKCTGLTSRPNKHITINNMNIFRCKNGYGIRVGCSDYVTINNVNIESTSAEHAMSIGVSGEPCKYVEVNNVNINSTTGSGKMGFLIGSGTSNVNVNNLVVRNSASRSLSIDTANNITFNNCQFITAGAYNYMTSSKHIKISNSLFSGNTAEGLKISSSSYFTIQSSTFINDVECGINSAGPNTDYNILGCKFLSITGSTAAFYISAIDQNFTITGCEFKGTGGNGFDSSAAACRNFTIIGNLFQNSGSKSMNIAATGGDFIITNNICYPASDEIDLNAANSSTRICSNNIAWIVPS